tara:strand:+ start:575 stop:763 length:189 start_codon:yes stop_codon:yes gene_type:complete
LQHFSINFKEKDKKDYLVDVINNNIVPSIPSIRKENEFIVILNKIAQYLGKKSIDYKHGQIF